MTTKRIKRLNSLLREVISEVIMQDVKNPHLAKFITVTNVDVTGDLKYAKVSISVIGTDEERKKSIDALNQAAGFISVHASKKIRIRYFPSLTFELDTSVEKHMKIEKILSEIKKNTPEEDE
ncbi:MAG: 30S ribosome-binding factor RbfA [Parachlamydiales bacterium]|nr:30S ribosome-binding factor RbfA [Parachlamydiales bacterium]